MASFSRWKIPQTRSGRRSISVAKLLKRESEGKLFKKHAEHDEGGLKEDRETQAWLAKRNGRIADRCMQHGKIASKTHDYDYSDNEFSTTGIPARLRRHRLELPARDEVDILPKPVAERRQDSQGTITMGNFATPGAFDDLGKSAAVPTMFQHAVDNIFGIQGVYHGTSPEAAASIRKGGLQPQHGGLHTAKMLADDGPRADLPADQRLKAIAEAKGSIFVSDAPSVAETYATQHGGPKGEVLHGFMPAERFLDRFKPDEHEWNAFRSNQALEPDVFNQTRESVLKARLSDKAGLLGYMKQNPKRVLKGVVSGTIASMFEPKNAITGLRKLVKGASVRDKISRAMETLGELSRSWEVPSSDEDRASAQQVDHHGPFGLTLSEISAQAGDAQEGTGQSSEVATRVTKNASISFEAFAEELGRLGAVTDGQLQKVAEVTREQAQHALGHLETLENQRPTIGQLGRGALVGSLVGPVASNVNKLISKGEVHTPREILGQLAGGAIFGTVTPLLKHKVETGTERKVLKDYVETGHGGRLATKIESKLGTP